MTQKLLDVAIVMLTTSLLLIVALGGADYDWGILRIRLHGWERPLALLVAALAARLWLARFDARYLATCGLLSMVLAAAAVCATYQVRVCGGLDSYGYVSTAALMASGRLSEPQPLVPLLPFEHASSAAAPLGYIAGVDGHTQVPRFPLGLPVVMALFGVFGAKGPFFAPLVMAYLTVVLAFLLASPRKPPGDRDVLTGLFAAALVAIDPLMVDYAIQPMSDVPAAFWLLAAVWLRMNFGGSGNEFAGSKTKRGRVPFSDGTVEKGTRPLFVSGFFLDPATLAGFCAGMAFLTRPALLLAAIALAAVTLDRPRRETVRFGVTLALFVALQMATNVALYGSARLSGYGPALYMFDISWSRLAANAWNFGKWLTHSHTALFWLLWPGALVVLRHKKWAWQLSAVAGAAAVPYLFYLVFDDWEASRFVLPSILLVLVMVARALGVILARRAAGPLLFGAIALACAVASHRFLQREGVYRLRDVEAKYPLAAEWIAAHTPERAVVLAGLHSGSIRFYGRRQTIRWDQIPPDQLTPTLRNLEAAGYEAYLALDEPSEPPLFAERFGADPAARIEPIGRVRVVNIYRFVSAR